MIVQTNLRSTAVVREPVNSLLWCTMVTCSNSLKYKIEMIILQRYTVSTSGFDSRPFCENYLHAVVLVSGVCMWLGECLPTCMFVYWTHICKEVCQQWVTFLNRYICNKQNCISRLLYICIFVFGIKWYCRCIPQLCISGKDHRDCVCGGVGGWLEKLHICEFWTHHVCACQRATSAREEEQLKGREEQ